MVLANDIILGVPVHVGSYDLVTQVVMGWCRQNRGRYVVAANVYTITQACDWTSFADVVRGADLVVPDGMPLVWLQRLHGYSHASRVYGPSLMLHLCAAAEETGVPIALYGGRSENLPKLESVLRTRFPKLNIACAISPPFRELMPEEDKEILRRLRESGAQIFFVGIGSPKQEQWMAQHVQHLSGVMLGVGAAFDFFSGAVKQAPAMLQNLGLEWLFRLLVEPRRLWRRYLIHNPRFVWMLMTRSSWRTKELS